MASVGDEGGGKRPWIVALRILDLFCGQERTLSGFMQNNMFLRTLIPRVYWPPPPPFFFLIWLASCLVGYWLIRWLVG